MAISVVQVNSNHVAGGTTLDVTVTSVTAGYKLIVPAYVISGSITLNTPTDNTASGTWTLKYNPATGGGNTHYWWEKEAVGGETTVTVTPSASATYGFAVYEVSGLLDADSFDVGVKGNTTTAQASPQTITTASTGTLAQANEIVIAMGNINGSFTTESITDSIITPTTYGDDDTPTTRGWWGSDIKSATTALTVSTDVTHASTRQIYFSAATFKADSATNATPTPAVIAVPVTVGAPTVSVGSTVSPTVVSAVVSMDAMSAELSATVTPAVVAASVAVGAVLVNSPGATIETPDGVTLSVQFSPTTRPLETPVWVEIASLIRENTGVQIRRGRSSELDRFQAGTCSFTLDNRDLLFDSSNTDGDFYGDLLPMRRVRVQATYSGTTYDLFEGFILGWPQSYDLSNNDAVVEIRAVDAFEILENTTVEDNFLILDDVTFGRLDFNRLGGDDVTITEETAGGQLATVLNIAGWPAGERDLADGINVMEAGTLSGSVLAYCQNVEDSEDGFFFVAKDGDVTFLGRDARWLNSRLTTTQFTLADDGADMPYSDVSLRYDRDFIFNDVTRTGSGEPQRSADSASMAEYGRRRDEKSGLVANDAGLKAVADYRVARFADPMVRPEPVRVPVRARVAQIPNVLGAELLDRVVLERRPMGGTVRTFTGLLQSIDLNISQVRFDAVFTLSPGDVDDTQYLVLDDATDGLLDTAAMAY